MECLVQADQAPASAAGRFPALGDRSRDLLRFRDEQCDAQVGKQARGGHDFSLAGSATGTPSTPERTRTGTSRRRWAIAGGTSDGFSLETD